MRKNERIAERLKELRAFPPAGKHTGFLITSYSNRRYYSGFTGSNGNLIVTPDVCVLVTDKRYTTQAALETSDCRIIETTGAQQPAVTAKAVRSLNLTELIVEKDLSVGEYFALRDELPDISFRLERSFFLNQRMRKDPDEIEAIRRAIACAARSFAALIPRLRTGMTEKDLQDELEYLCAKNGAERMSFDTIVSAGERAAMAHGAPTGKKIENGQMVVVDFGVVLDGYVSDMTRTLLFGEISPENRRIFDLVRQAQKTAIAAIRPGVTAGEVEQAHRAVFQSAGMEPYALKGLGHGIGLQIHENPSIVIGGPTVLAPRMIFTVEPGLYIPGVCGVRTEDVVLVTQDGCEDLTQTPHEIRIEAR